MELLVQCLRHQILGMRSLLIPCSLLFSSWCSFLDRVTSPRRCLHGNGTEAHERIWSSERDIQS
ncbi:hypothetical protein Peur_042086 [Populus x canadensis]